jgi:hypothetical protein
MPLLHENYYGTTWDPARFTLGALRKLGSDGDAATPLEPEPDAAPDAAPAEETA